ncbi:MAG: alpha/beta fold hydrolase [Puniceicoccales bacterium]
MSADDSSGPTEVFPPSLRLLYPFEPKRIVTSTGTISVVDEGEGPAVVFVHGNPSWSFLFRDVILALRDRFRCIAPDHQGCGFSDPQPHRMRMIEHSQNLGKVLETLQVEKFILIAHDWGGAIGAHQAGLQPDRVAGMVFLNTAAFPLKRMPWQIRLARVPVLGRILMERYNAFALGAAKQGVVEPLRPAAAEGLLYPWLEKESRKAVSAFVEDIPWSANHPTRPTIEETEKGLEGLQDKPCLLAWGMRDFCFDEKFLDEWIRRFPNAQVERYQEAGHYVFEDAGADLVERISQFVDSVSY